MEQSHLREHALAEAYFRQIKTERTRRRGATSDQGKLLAELGAELEIEDVTILSRLIALGVTPDTAPAFEALPLVEVAWADGEIDEEERWRVLTVATAFGLELGRLDHAQLELWLTRRPDQALFDAWYAFAAGLAVPEAAQRARRVLEGAHEVAMAAGGLLGGGGISRSERAVIGRINQALANSRGQADKS